MIPRLATFALLVGLSTVGAGACSSSSTSAAEQNADGGTADAADQTPPTTSAAAVDAWLATGEYKAWHCQAAATAGTGISPHGAHRICSNDLLSAFSGSGEYPVGSANVKVLYNSVGGSVTGYAVELRVSSGSTGDDWFWYEKMGTNAAVGDGTGVALCVGCHMSAGSPGSQSGHDFVFSQVR